MHDPLTFETRLVVALGRYADQVPTDVDAAAFVRATRSAPVPHITVWRTARPMRLAILLGLLVALALAAALVVGGQPSPAPRPSTTVSPSLPPNVTTVASGMADTAIGRMSWTAVKGDASNIPAADIFETPDGFAAVEEDPDEGSEGDSDEWSSRFWVSNDGLNWAVAPMPVPAGGRVEHRVAAGEHWIWSGDDFRMWRSSDFVTWTEVDLGVLKPPSIANVDWSFGTGGPVTVGSTSVLPFWSVNGRLALFELLGIPIRRGDPLSIGPNGEPDHPSLGDTREVFRRREDGWEVVGSFRVELNGTIVTVTDVDRDVVIAEIDATSVGVPAATLAADLNEGGIGYPGDGVVITDSVPGPVALPSSLEFLTTAGGRFLAMTGDTLGDVGGTGNVWASTNGLDWESLGPPSFPAEGFHIFDQPDGGSGRPLTIEVSVELTDTWELWSSVDGRTWTRLGVLPPRQVPTKRSISAPSRGYLTTADDRGLYVSETGADWTAVEGLEGGFQSPDEGTPGPISVAGDHVFIVERWENQDRVMWVLTIDADG